MDFPESKAVTNKMRESAPFLNKQIWGGPTRDLREEGFDDGDVRYVSK